MADNDLIKYTLPGHTRPVVGLCFSNDSKDGVFIITACHGIISNIINVLDKLPMLRNAENGDWIGTFTGHRGAVWSAKININSTLALTGSADFTANLWDATTGKLKHTFEHHHIVRSVCFSKTEREIATGGKEKKFRLFNIAKPAEPVVTYDFETDINQINTYTAHSYLIATTNGNLHLFDSSTNKIEKTVPIGQKINDLELARSGDIITIATGHNVKFLDSKTFEVIKQYDYDFEIECASLRNDKERFVYGGEDMRVHEANYENGEEISNLGGHFGAIHCIRYHPAGDRYVSGGDDSSVRMWKYKK